MFTFVLMYIFFYVFIILSLLILSFVFLPLSFLTQFSLTSYLVIIQKYTAMRGIFFFCVFSLSGLPPVGLFFVKFNIFLFLIYQTHFIFIIVLFFIFLLNMFYYIQLFNVKNFKTPVYAVIKPVIFLNYQETYNITTLSLNYSKYHLMLFINTFFGLIVLNLLFYSDLYLILHL